MSERNNTNGWYSRVEAMTGKSAMTLTRRDIVDLVMNEGIEMVNFMYPAADGRLKTLSFPVTDREYLETVLAVGERVDGSSLFPGIGTGKSDLYVVPRYSTAFIDPLAPVPTLALLCSYFDGSGQPSDVDPRETLVRACDALQQATGMELEAMGELEYYVVSPDTGVFPADDQRGYHESAPFAKHGDFRARVMGMIASAGCRIKYGHGEVGSFVSGGMAYEQHEIEFLPVAAPDGADQLMIAKWMIRNLAAREGLEVTFAPKITAGKAGSGMHIHLRLLRPDGTNALVADGSLTDDARRAIAGVMELAPALTAFGNRVPTSYLRLVPHQEAPTAVCWGRCNRSALVRVPLGWTAGADMTAIANPGETGAGIDTAMKQTFELRSPDASADIYLLMAGLAVACRHGWEMAGALDLADATYVDVNIHSGENASRAAALKTLPGCCAESAVCLRDKRGTFEAMGVFRPSLIDMTAASLERYGDTTLREEIARDHALMQRLVGKYFHCG